MKRRKFMIGAGSTAIGASALVGSGAVSLVASKRTAKVQIAHDESAYLGLKRGDGPNASYTSFDEKGHLYIDMTPKNPTEGGGTGVNSDSLSYFKNLFQICNQGKQPMTVYMFLIGDHAKRVSFSVDGTPCHGVKLDVGECVDVDMWTWTKSLPANTRLLERVLIVAVGDDLNPDTGSTAAEHVPEEAEPNDELVEGH